METPSKPKLDRAGKVIAFTTRIVGLLGVINFFVLLNFGNQPNPIILTTVGALVAGGEAVDRIVQSLRPEPLPAPREEEDAWPTQQRRMRAQR